MFLRPHACKPTMTLFYLTIPLMVVAVAIAVVPVLVWSFRHKKSLDNGHYRRPSRWHRNRRSGIGCSGTGMPGTTRRHRIWWKTQKCSAWCLPIEW